MFAQSVHQASSRATGPFVAVNCAAIPDTLLESELFGYEGGAFTGAGKEGKPGLFEQAHQGTIFLDEIGDIPLPLQARLLRVLQEREVRRVGSNRIISVDIRIISATSKNLLQKVQKGTFRDDLYYWLNVLNLKVPPLRERNEDIALIAEKLRTQFNVTVTPEIMSTIVPGLTAYDWPGNIRELTNILERLSLIIDNPSAPSKWSELLEQVLQVSAGDEPQVVTLLLDMNRGLKNLVREVERKVVGEMLVRNNNDLSAIAEQLKIGRTSVWRKVRSEMTH
ncbi:sigma 54-interacting transcriptional regulator [Breoghania sp.]|uniref:sigma-54 interaction domain-containing protein n=1 Tax=Breoghania sp. TaxID=2065378 RepID=UPI0026104D5B|nr:sigma 54-interacting transcriptional regulator [Breoghania sp.]MDJ0931697.1 sigma 54-interacting transcriptional regulator [Breoghania sp.]